MAHAKPYEVRHKPRVKYKLRSSAVPTFVCVSKISPNDVFSECFDSQAPYMLMNRSSTSTAVPLLMTTQPKVRQGPS